MLFVGNITFFIFAVFDVRRSVAVNMCINCSFFKLMDLNAGRSGLVVTRLPAAREDPGSKICVFTKIIAIRSFWHGLHTDCSA